MRSFMPRSIADCLPLPLIRMYSGSLLLFFNFDASVDQKAVCCLVSSVPASDLAQGDDDEVARTMEGISCSSKRIDVCWDTADPRRPSMDPATGRSWDVVAAEDCEKRGESGAQWS
mmetsp:Transcript_79134/g.210151  ORF Transcript_79134/g.210151 Transcript_79134/m.210151 type:complete len:116 (+) Transcript_79134:461-808(+)